MEDSTSSGDRKEGGAGDARGEKDEHRDEWLAPEEWRLWLGKAEPRFQSFWHLLARCRL